MALKIENKDFKEMSNNAMNDATKMGYMTKQGQMNKSSKERRFFVLNGTCLYYFMSDDPNSCKGLIWLEGSSVEEGKDSASQICINTCSGRTYSLTCDQANERDDWIRTIQLAQYSTLKSEFERIRVENQDLSANHKKLVTDMGEINKIKAENIHAMATLEAENTKLREVVEARKIAEEKMERLLSEHEFFSEPGSVHTELERLFKEHKELTSCKGIRVLSQQEISRAGDQDAALRIWVGTWNMGAVEPFDPSGGNGPGLLKQSFISDKEAAQIYVMGVQEGASDNVFNATETLLGMTANCVRLPLDDTKNKKGAEESNELGHCSDRIRGRGDGSLVSTKFTGIAVFVNADLLESKAVRLIGCVAHPLEKLGSKGGVAICLNIAGSTVVFVTCHLEANSYLTRREQYETLVSNLGSSLGEADFDLTSQFHHVIWCGDLNYRCVKSDGPDAGLAPLTSEKVVKKLQEGENRELFDRHDQLNHERKSGYVFYGFDEPMPLDDFYPTYKKFENRRKTNYDIDWVTQVYRTKYKEPIYKGGQTKERTPGYCDRVLYRSMNDVSSCLQPAMVSVDVAYFGADGSDCTRSKLAHNYRSVNDGEGMTISDHSPVAATFTLSSPGAYVARRALETRSSTTPSSLGSNSSRKFSITKASSTITPEDTPLGHFINVSLKIEKIQTVSQDRRSSVHPRRAEVLFPSPHEIENGTTGVKLWNSETSPGGLSWQDEAGKNGCRRLGWSNDQGVVDMEPGMLELVWNGENCRPSNSIPIGNLHMVLRLAFSPTDLPSRERTGSNTETDNGGKRKTKMNLEANDAVNHGQCTVCLYDLLKASMNMIAEGESASTLPVQAEDRTKGETMDVYVKTFIDSNLQALTVPKSGKVKDITKQLNTGSCCSCRLFFGGVTLQEDRTLAYYHIDENATLTMIGWYVYEADAKKVRAKARVILENKGKWNSALEPVEFETTLSLFDCEEHENSAAL